MFGFGAGRGRTLRSIVPALGATQIIGWGTTYYLPAILAPDLAAATGLPVQVVFGGITVMLLVAGLAAPLAGRLIERDGARPWLTAGSAGIAAGLLALAVAHGPVLFGLGWIVIGVATPFALSQGAANAVVEVTPANESRRPLTVILLFSGLASTAFWPVLILFDGWFGLRWSLAAFAGLHLLVCAPLHALVLPSKPIRPISRVTAALAGERPPISAGAASRIVFRLTALSFSLAGFISWGLPLHAIAILQDYGHPRAAAVAIGAVLGPAQVLSRLIDLAGGHRIDILTTGVAAALAMPFAILTLLLFGTRPSAAIVFVATYGISAGTMSLVRAVGPLRLFGRAAYATVTGRLSQPQNVAFALSPLVFSLIRESYGSQALLLTALAAAVLCVVAIVSLARVAPPPFRET